MQTAYNGGELSPSLYGRPDHEIWTVALAECVGWTPRIQGPLETIPGFEYVETAAAQCRLLAFEPFTTQGYVIEASNALFRFYTNDVRIETSPGVAYEVAHPYTLAQVQELWTEASVDVLYLFHRAVQPRELARTGASTFALSELALENGPFMDRNADESLTLSFGGVVGSVTVTASAALFAATDVGRLIEVEAEDLSDIPSWEPGITVTLAQLLQWDGRVYQVVGGGGTTKRTGSVQPVHTRGVEWDGIGSGADLNEKDAGGVELLYMHDMFGRLRITAFTSSTVVTATVTRRLPLQLATSYTLANYVPGYYTPDVSYDGTGSWTSPGTGSYTSGTWRWRLGAYSDTTGWPTHGIVYNQRLYLFRDNRIDASVAGSLTDFDRLNEFGEISVDQAFSLTIDDPNAVAWVSKGSELFIGTANAEYVLRQASAAQPLGPGNVDLKRQEHRGSAPVRPTSQGGRPIFLQRDERKLLHMAEVSGGVYEGEDITRYADHIGNSRIVEMAWQMEPQPYLWAVRADGTLALALYSPREGVLGWVRRELAEGFTAESICAITGPDGKSPQLWLAALYNAGGPGAQRFVMKLGEWRRAGEQPANPVMLDAALLYDGAAASIFAVPHLPNTTVEVVANGIWLGEYETDADGEFDISPFEAETAMAGLPFPAYFTVLPIEAGGDSGPAQMKMKRPSRVTLRVQNALGLQVEREVSGETKVLAKVLGLMPGDNLESAITPVTADVALDIVGGWDRNGQFTVRRAAPYMSTVVAHTAIVESSQR